MEEKVTVEKKLKDLGVADDIVGKIKAELGVETVDDLSRLTEEDLVGIGMKKIQARKTLDSLVPATTSANTFAVSIDTLLPAVPTDESWLTALKVGGVLKVEQSTVISAIRAALADRVGLYEVPKILVLAMEKFADANDDPVGTEFFKLRKQITQHNYADIFEAIPGLEGSFVTEGRKKEFFRRVNDNLWSSIIGFNDQLKAWQEAWQGSANPAMMLNVLMSLAGGSKMMPPGVMQPPDTGALRDYADTVADAINKVFAGPGIQIAAALAYDATKIRETLSNPGLPASIGAANRDQMLKQLGVAVSANYPRLETNLTRFVLATMQVKDQQAGNEELQYFGALYMLGSQIPWNDLSGGGRRPTGIGRKDL
jgi:hypothetical protein